ncbi:unnamed protein product [Arctogadus glacialis]
MAPRPTRSLQGEYYQEQSSPLRIHWLLLHLLLLLLLLLFLRLLLLILLLLKQDSLSLVLLRFRFWSSVFFVPSGVRGIPLFLILFLLNGGKLYPAKIYN